jgi:hypothetical protein
MTWRKLGPDFDTRVANLAERTTRRLTRRDALRAGVMGGAAGIAALTLGQSPASAKACDCGRTPRCNGCGSNGCPSGYSLCKGSKTSHCFNNQGYRCEWVGGSWIACTGQGRGHGYFICRDCKGSGGCATWCTCLSTCICCQCLTSEDVRAEQKRLQELGAG